MPKEPNLSELRWRIKWPATTAFILGVLGYLPFSTYVILIFGDWARYASSAVGGMQFTGWEVPLRLLAFGLVFPLTTLSLPFAFLGLLRIRRYGDQAAVSGMHAFLMWAWLACAFAILIAALNAVQLLVVGSDAYFYF